MDARIVRLVVLLGAGWSLGASVRTEHFIVSAPNRQMAEQVAKSAEHYREQLAIEWLGQKLPRWADPCPIQVQLAQHASGETSFEFPVGGGHPRNWRMIVSGPFERIMDSVLPHEILHTVFATHFENPLPRWADEGACTTVEGATERVKHDHMLITFLKSDKGIPFNKMFRMREYPRDILPLYSQGYSVASYLIHQGGKQKFVGFVGEGMQTNNWTAALQQSYDYKDLSDLQVQWVDWVAQGSPPLATRGPQSLLANRDDDSENALVSADMPADSRNSGMGRAARAIAPAPSSARGGGEGRARSAAGLKAPQGRVRVMDDSGWYKRQAKQSQSSETNRQLKSPTPPVGGPLWKTSRARSNTMLR